MVVVLCTPQLSFLQTSADSEISVDSVADGDEAVEAFKKKTYVLVFMDLHMSRMSGLPPALGSALQRIPLFSPTVPE